MKPRPYSDYKDSGVEWLGAVPAHWKVKRLRHVLTRNDGGVWGEEDDPEGTIVLRSTEQSADGEWQISDPAKRNLSPREKFAALLKKGDLVVTKSSGSALHIGKTSLVSEAVEALQPCYSNFMQRLRVVPNLDPRLVFFVLNSATGRQQLVFNSNTTTGLSNLNGGVLGNVFVTVPPSAEQRAIAAYLDRETGRVDELVGKQRALIERLKEKRTALISRTVTRGLPPAAARAAGLPENPPLKPSGVEWLGDIPAHWTAKKLGYGAYLQGGYAFASEKFDSEGVPVVRMNNLKRGVLDLTEASCVAPEHCVDGFALREGDLLWGMSGSIGETGSLGNFARVRSADLPAQLNQRVGRFQVLGGAIVLGYLAHVIQTKLFYDQILLEVTGTAQFNVSSEQVQSAVIPFPPPEEQTAIAAYLDTETAKLDALVAKVETVIERLQEYRAALITAAVTGKIDVRNAVLA